MKNTFYYLSIGLLAACSPNRQPMDTNDEESYLAVVQRDGIESPDDVAFINQNGDTLIPFGKYTFSFADTITHYGVVAGKNGELIAIDPLGKELYRVFTYDNGPDYIEDGLFRIIENGKIGYANGETGEVVIKPRYTCAFPFENGKAKVSLNCSEEQVGEYSEWVSDQWIFIDKTGKVMEK